MKFKTFLFLVACGGGAWYYFHDKDDAPNAKDDTSAVVTEQAKTPAAEKNDAPKVKNDEAPAVPKREGPPAKEEPSQESGHAKAVSVDDAVQMLKRYGILDEYASGKFVTSVGSDIGREFKENPVRAVSEGFLYHFMMYKDGVENLSEYPYIDKMFELYQRANAEQQGKQVGILRKLPVQCLEAFAAAGVKISNFQECSGNLFAVDPPDPKLVTFLCTHCAKTSPDQVNVAGANGWTPLMYVACYSPADACAEACRLLIQAGARVNVQKNDGWTPLMLAARNSTAEACRLLIQAGAKVDEKNNDSTTALMLATCNTEHPDVCGVLLDAGASVHTKDKDGCTPFVWAARNSSAAICDRLIKLGADVHAKDNNGWTPLMIAARYSTTDVCRLLIQAGAKVDEKNNDSATALMLATCNTENPDVCGVLLDAGASVHEKNKYGSTPLAYAAQYSPAAICDRLIKLGADVNVRDNNGWTPLMTAARYSTADTCQLLIQAGADIDAKNNDGWTALSLAVFCGDDDKVDMLIKNRASVRVSVSYEEKHLSLLELAEELNQELSSSFKKESLIKSVREGYPGAKLNYQRVVNLLEAVPAARIPQYEGSDAGNGSFSADQEPPDSGVTSPIIPAAELAKLDPLIARMRALRCKHASSALYQRRLLTLLPMIRNGADINITLQETKGNTALHYSCAIGSWSITQWLVNHGADVNAVTDKGATPLDCVGDDNAARIRALLLAHGAKYAFELGVNDSRGVSSPEQTDLDIAAQNGDADAQYRLGLAYQFAKGRPQNYSEAAHWYRRAAEQGHAAAQNNLGFCYHNGWGVPQDYSQAAYWYRLSAQQGLALGESNYGTCLEFGWGVRKDLSAAIEMYRRAALQGNESGKKHLRRHGITP